MTGRKQRHLDFPEVRHFEAPRISAASIGSLGSSQPASMMMNENGDQFQIFQQHQGRQARYWGCQPCRLDSMPLRRVMTSLIGRSVQHHFRRNRRRRPGPSHRQNEMM